MSLSSDPAPAVDVLGEPYLAETLPLPDDDEGEVVATLVSRRAERPTGGAVLHVHGFADYFFQTPAADYWVGQGYDFYALDLRKYGRSLRPHQTPNFVLDLRDYYAELDEALRRIRDRDGHDQVIVSAHSTGGLIAPLWAHDRRVRLAGVVLNSPWLDLRASVLLRTAATKAIDQIGARRPYLTIPREVSGLYAQSLHCDHRGEWSFDLAWKPLESWPVYAGWLRAVRRGHARAHRGLDLDAPVLVLTSGASAFPKVWDDTVDCHDIVLDVEQIRKWAPKLGDHVTMVRIPGAIHDVTLSRLPVRTRVFAEITGWLDGFVRGSERRERGEAATTVAE
ncbi:MAG TPA: alpha/beta hydrolase [Nocardioidaceae bacterium]|jgi:alpha-beta hydrolase superfamily lysophospholipase|nr:alpha/beta hydrolase [Nocardioidaceae bacterium]